MNDFKNDVIAELPDIMKVSFLRIDKNYLKVILINVSFLFVPLLVGVFLLTGYIEDSFFSENVFYFYIAYIIILAWVLFIVFVGFSKRKYALRERDISYKSGIFFKKITTVPFSRIQHVEIDEGPISRLFKLSTLSVFTAGDSSDDLKVKGISKVEAMRIKDFITSQING